MFKRIIFLIILVGMSPLHALKRSDHLPIVFHKSYDISFGWLDKLHPFDGNKYGKVHHDLVQNGVKNFYTPELITDEQLLTVHTAAYLKSLTSSFNIAKIAEVAPLALVPNCLLQRWLLKPMKYA